MAWRVAACTIRLSIVVGSRSQLTTLFWFRRDFLEMLNCMKFLLLCIGASFPCPPVRRLGRSQLSSLGIGPRSFGVSRAIRILRVVSWTEPNGNRSGEAVGFLGSHISWCETSLPTNSRGISQIAQTPRILARLLVHRPCHIGQEPHPLVVPHPDRLFLTLAKHGFDFLTIRPPQVVT